jgi:hypothetical protein
MAVKPLFSDQTIIPSFTRGNISHERVRRTTNASEEIAKNEKQSQARLIPYFTSIIHYIHCPINFEEIR